LENIILIKDTKIRDQFLCLFSSTLEFNNLFCSFKGEGTGAVRHLFSNHILKPERTPIENSVWGTDKSNGTFSTLYRSRLLKAKLYLNAPFEIRLENDIFNNPTGVSKIVASKPIHITKVNSWTDLVKNSNSIFIFNGDSSATCIPDKSVNTVVTDPPYFDFINYSELSDFFYAWLAPVLKKRFSYFNTLGDFKLSENDKFVIETALLLVQLNGLKLSYERICEYLINKGFVNSTEDEDGYITPNDTIIINN
jgi:putative DNA methylase